MKTNRWLIAALLLLLLPAGMTAVSELKLWRLKAEAVGSPLACALYAAHQTGHPGNGEAMAETAIAYAKAGDFDRASRIIDSIEETAWFVLTPRLRFHFQTPLIGNQEYKAEACFVAALLCQREGLKTKAEEFFSGYQQLSEKLTSPYEREEYLERIALRCAELGEDEQAVQVISNQHYGLLKLSGKYIELGRREKAESVLVLVSGLIDSVDEPERKGSIVTDIAEKYLKAGNREMAFENLEKSIRFSAQVKDKIYAPDYKAPVRSQMLARVSEIWAEAGQCERARQTAQTIEDDDTRSAAIGRLIPLCVRAIGFDQAGSMAKTLHYYDRGHALSGIASGLAEEAKYEEALQTAAQIESASQKVEALLGIAGQYARAGERKRAAEILTQAWVIERTRDYGPFTSTLTEIAFKYLEPGEQEKALQCFAEAGSQNCSGAELLEAANKVTRTGDYKLAIEIIGLITSGTCVEDVWNATSSQLRAEAVVEVAIRLAESRPTIDDETRKLIRELISLL